MMNIIYTVRTKDGNVFGVYTNKETARAALVTTMAISGGGTMTSEVKFMKPEDYFFKGV